MNIMETLQPDVFWKGGMLRRSDDVFSQQLKTFDLVDVGFEKIPVLRRSCR